MIKLQSKDRVKYEESIVIDAPIDAVWSALEKVKRWPEWVPGVTRVEGLTDVAQPGSVCNISHAGILALTHLPKEEILFSKVIPNQHMTFVRNVPGMEISTDYAVDALSNIKTKVTREVTASGGVHHFLGRIPGFTPSEPAPKNLMAKLKSYVEQSLTGTY